MNLLRAHGESVEVGLAALRMGADQVIAIDRFPERSAMAVAIGADAL